MRPSRSTALVGALVAVAAAGLTTAVTIDRDDDTSVLTASAPSTTTTSTRPPKPPRATTTVAETDAETETEVTATPRSRDEPVARSSDPSRRRRRAADRSTTTSTTTAAEPATEAAPAGTEAKGCDGAAPVLDQRGVWLVSGGDARHVIDRRAESLHWSRDGRYVAARVDIGGALALDIVDVATGRVDRVEDATASEVPAWTTDGQLLVVFGTEVHAIAPETGAATVLYRGDTEAMAVAAGDRMALVRDGTNLHAIDLASGETSTIASGAGLTTPIALSADDRWVAYADHPLDELVTIVTMAIDGSSVREHGSGGGVRSTVWSGSSIVSSGFDTDGIPFIWSASPTADGHAVVAERAGSPILSGDEVVFEDSDRGAVAIAALDGSNRRTLARSASLPAAGGGTIAFAQHGVVCATDAGGAAARRLVTPGDGQAASLLALSDDGAAVAVSIL